VLPRQQRLWRIFFLEEGARNPVSKAGFPSLLPHSPVFRPHISEDVCLALAQSAYLISSKTLRPSQCAVTPKTNHFLRGTNFQTSLASVHKEKKKKVELEKGKAKRAGLEKSSLLDYQWPS
jgi:hypothetical protein